MSDRVIVVLLSAGLLTACGAKGQQGETNGAAASGTAPSAGACSPRILQLERRVEVQVQGEWVTAGLFVAGCAETLASLKAEDRTAAVAALKELANKNPRVHLNVCEGADRVAPDDATVAAVNSRLGRKVFNDWCWDVLSVSGAV